MTPFIIITTVFSTILLLILIYIIVKRKKTSQINVEKKETIKNNKRVPIAEPQIKKPITESQIKKPIKPVIEEKVKTIIPKRNTKLVKKNESKQKQNQPPLPTGEPPPPINIKKIQKTNLFLLQDSPRTKKNIRFKNAVKRIINVKDKKNKNTNLK